MKKIIFAVLLACLSAGCSATDRDEKSVYTIDATFDAEGRFFECEMGVRWTNTSDVEVSGIPFIFYGEPDTGLIEEIKVGGEPVKYAYGDGDFFTVDVPGVAPGKSVEMKLRFRTNPVSLFRGCILLYDDDFPVIAYHDHNGFNTAWHVHADYEVTLTLPSDYNIAPTGTITGISSRDAQRTFTTFATDVPWYGFAVLSDSIAMLQSEAGGVAIRTFYFPHDSLWAPKLEGYAKDILQFYTAELGFYPQPVVNIIPGYNVPAGGWPVCPNVVGIHMGLDRKPEDHAHWITAHELGHQYWGFNYTTDPTDYPDWLGIGLGIYTDRLYSRHAGIGLDYDDYFYEDYVKGAEKGINTTIMRTVSQLDEEDIDWNNIIVHGKGWAVIRMLEQKLGEDVFRQAYDLFLQRSPGRNLTPEDFRSVCEEVSGLHLEDFFHTWLHTDGHIAYRVTDSSWLGTRGAILATIELEKTGAIIPDSLEIAFHPLPGKGEVTVKSYALEGEKLKISELLEFAPEKFVIDPAGKLPLVGTVREHHIFSPVMNTGEGCEDTVSDISVR